MTKRFSIQLSVYFHLPIKSFPEVNEKLISYHNDMLHFTNENQRYMIHSQSTHRINVLSKDT